MGTLPQGGKVRLANTDLSYLEWTAVGEPLVLLHATGMHPWLWHPIVMKLWPKYRIVAPYLCDHRKVDPDQGGLDWYQLAQDISLLMAQLQIERPFLAGHSMGGTVAAIAEANFNIKARAMLLIEPIFLVPEIYRLELTLQDHPLASKAIRRTNHWPNREIARQYLETSTLFSSWHQEIRELYLEHCMLEKEGSIRLACAPRMEAAIFMGGLKYDPWPDLSRIECPSLLVEGDRSTNRQYVDLPKAAAMMPYGKYLLVPKAGHLLPMDDPAATARIMAKFFLQSG